jgi:hypothetical protein
MPRPHIADYSPQLFILFPPFSRKKTTSLRSICGGGAKAARRLFAFRCLQPPLSAASLSILSSQRERLYGNYFHSYDCATRRTHNAELSPQFAFLNDNGDVEQRGKSVVCSAIRHRTHALHQPLSPLG